MTHLSMTPFGRQPVTAALVDRARQVREMSCAAAPAAVDKWAVHRMLTTARERFEVSDRDLAVLAALLSFLPAKELRADAPAVVFPSNASLSERAHGMAESTLRRHLAALVRAGLVLRQDSPNGKRYAARGRDGELVVAYGFDLAPLRLRAAEISEVAAEVEAQALALRRAREEMLLLRRDVLKLLEYAAREGLPVMALEEAALPLARAPRRKLQMPAIEAHTAIARGLLARLHRMLDSGEHLVEVADAEDPGGSDIQNERHLQNSHKDSSEFEPSEETRAAHLTRETATEPVLPIGLVLKACPALLDYAGAPLRNWGDLVMVADRLRGMMGISPDAWVEACTEMGPVQAAITVAAILQRFDSVRSPGGYLRSLSRKAGSGGFSPAPMVMALLRAA